MAFEPTHVVPQGGLPAWAAPDGSQPPAANLAPGTELQAVEWQGAWARVEAANGWTGWVDGGQLAQRGAVPPAPPPGTQVGPTVAVTTTVTGEAGQPRPTGKSILLAIITFGIYTFFWTYRNHEEIKRHSGIGLGGVVGVIVYIFVSPATYFLIPSEVKQLYERSGWQSPVQATIGFWFLLPLIGSFIWYTRVQGAINEYWYAKGAPRL